MQIREYIPEDSSYLTKILYLAVHNIPTDIYTREQQNAWAPISILEQNLNLTKTWVCLIDDTIAGFIDFILSKGHINYLYTHPNYQRKGIASLLYEKVETEAIRLQIEKLTTDASKVALPFFLHKGFTLERENIVERKGVEMINFTVSKIII
ncbi:GNAT family N-acetyltransferase [Dysgonomonas sp. HGC4]|uniref:GNAT family N-acetyltransferase n=1 Tax=Dysgonomonas sp. HGC4 TaxID=1658009 RepID=UPI00068058FB|nr:GNAT family N-acetyltransferase [Dysgonomonas sp. HGC4]MBD8349660.1 GNAT family N-acetyltransferase [Dysgonomonas sp. HGC4]